jgi:hypothetical protein
VNCRRFATNWTTALVTRTLGGKWLCAKANKQFTIIELKKLDRVNAKANKFFEVNKSWLCAEFSQSQAEFTNLFRISNAICGLKGQSQSFYIVPFCRRHRHPRVGI